MSEAPPPRRRRAWPWIVGGVVALLLIAGGISLAVNQPTSTTPTATPSPSPSVTESPTPSATPTPTVTPVPEPTPTETPTPTPTSATAAGPKLSADEVEFSRESMTSRNTAVLEGSMASTVTVVIAGQNCCGALSPIDAINELDYVIGSNPTWTFDLPPSTLEKYRAGKYGQYFPVNAVVGRSNNHEVFAFSYTSGKKLSAIFMAKGSF